MKNEQKKLLEEVMGADFVLIELNLFLDTHPDDRQALTDFSSALKQSVSLRARYEKEYGPLMMMSPHSVGNTFKWIDDPWPWEVNFA